MSSKQQWAISVVVDGVSLGLFDMKSGGDTMAKGNKHRAGGMGIEKSYASLPNYSDIKVSRVLERARDLELARILINKSGKGRMSVSEQALDQDGNAFGSPIVYSGRLLGVTPGDADSTSEAVRMFDLSMEVETVS